MGREIKFRGIDQNGKWQMGTYYFGVVYPTSFKGHYINDFMIDENTIGQFTGLMDKNGKDIYDGDIVESGNGRVWLVSFGEYLYHNQIPNYGFYLKSDTCSFPMQENKSTEIIGNIHENPELL